jgi:carboxyl-terminal processing protease
VNRLKPRKLLVGVGLALAAILGASGAPADEPPATGFTPQQANELAKLATQITDAVLDHHIDPPARQQMLLDGVKALYAKAQGSAPTGLSRRISELSTSEQLAALLLEITPKPAAKPSSFQDLESVFCDGLLRSMGGWADLVSAKDRRVAEQIEGNRYVGIHIALGTDDHEKRPKMHEVIEGGPADKAGVKKDDILEEVDGVDTKEMKLREVVDRLRGDDGTVVTIKVRQPNERQSRTMKITRGMLPRTTVSGIRKRSSGEWEVRLDRPDGIGYLRINDLMASTPHELRKLARQIESEGLGSVIIDLRGVHAMAVHPAVLVADALLERGSIGRMRTVEREVTYEADADALFRGWPMAVWVDQETAGTAAWIAAALEDNNRAAVVGGGARRFAKIDPFVRSSVPVGDGTRSLALLTGCLERGNGQPLGTATAIERIRGFVKSQFMPPNQSTSAGEHSSPPNSVAPKAEAPAGLKGPQPVEKRRASGESDVSSDPALAEVIRALREMQKRKS